jgi:hypothetical protein
MEKQLSTFSRGYNAGFYDCYLENISSQSLKDK